MQTNENFRLRLSSVSEVCLCKLIIINNSAKKHIQNSLIMYNCTLDHNENK